MYGKKVEHLDGSGRDELLEVNFVGLETVAHIGADRRPRRDRTDGRSIRRIDCAFFAFVVDTATISDLA
jgi:hypothetical protein